MSEFYEKYKFNFREKVFDAIADKYTKLSQKETKSKKSKKGK